MSKNRQHAWVPQTLSEAPLISVDSILILSVFLFGTMFQRIVDPEMERSIIFSGAIGIIAYVGLAYAAGQRRHLSMKRSREYFEARIDRHTRRRFRNVSLEPYCGSLYSGVLPRREDISAGLSSQVPDSRDVVDPSAN